MLNCVNGAGWPSNLGSAVFSLQPALGHGSGLFPRIIPHPSSLLLFVYFSFDSDTP